MISLVTGGVGGNIAGAIFKKLSLGVLGNTVAGLVGGGLGGPVLAGLLGGGTPLGHGGQIAGSGIGGLVVMAVVGLIKQDLAAKK